MKCSQRSLLERAVGADLPGLCCLEAISHRVLYRGEGALKCSGEASVIQMSVDLFLQLGLLLGALQPSGAGSRRKVPVPLEGWLPDMCLPIQSSHPHPRAPLTFHCPGTRKAICSQVSIINAPPASAPPNMTNCL